MKIVADLFYGLFSGLAEFLPVSPQAHQSIISSLFGVQADPLRDLLVHISCLIAVLICCRQLTGRIQYEMRLARRYRHTRSAKGTMRAAYDLKLIQTALFPALIVLLLQPKGAVFQDNRILVCSFLIINGIILFVTDHMQQGNKEAPGMSQLDAIGIGVSSILSVLPGISRFGMNTTFAVARGANRDQAVNWVYLLSIPVLVLFCIFDIVGILQSPVVGMNTIRIIGYGVCAVFAFIGSCIGISTGRMVISRNGFSGFAYYCWGAALFSFILYMII